MSKARIKKTEYFKTGCLLTAKLFIRTASLLCSKHIVCLVWLCTTQYNCVNLVAPHWWRHSASTNHCGPRCGVASSKQFVSVAYYAPIANSSVTFSIGWSDSVCYSKVKRLLMKSSDVCGSLCSVCVACYVPLGGWVCCFKTTICFLRISETFMFILRGTRLIKTFRYMCYNIGNNCVAYFYNSFFILRGF